jgi:hypothetical protein
MDCTLFFVSDTSVIVRLNVAWYGGYMVKLTRSEQHIAEKTACILLMRGTNPAGERLYAYVAVRADRLQEFMAAQSQPRFVLEDYAAVLESGLGEPSADVQEKMQKEYGFNHEQMVFLGRENPPSA